MLITQFVSICLLVIDFGVSADSSLTKDVLKPTKNSDLRGSKKSRRALSSDCRVSDNQWVGDGWCDKTGGYNTAECGWDGGDCCEVTCKKSQYDCTQPFECKDPSLSSLTLSLPSGRTFSKRGNRRTCAWDKCPSAKFPWNQQLGEGCTCVGGLNSCYMDGDATTIVTFDDAVLIPVGSGLNRKYLLADKNIEEMKIGEGSDTGSGSSCFDDPMRGGFNVDLTGTGYVFSDGSAVTLSGWSPWMRVIADGKVVDTVGKNASGFNTQVQVPAGSQSLEVVCGGWGGSCKSQLYVMEG